MSIDTRALRAESHPEIGTWIQQNHQLLVDRWCSRALSEIPSAARVHLEVLRDRLPSFLQGIGRSLSQTSNGAENQQYKMAVEHGDQRWDSGWSLSAVVRDYQLLQLVIFEFLEEHLGRSMHYREVMAIGVYIDDAI